MEKVNVISELYFLRNAATIIRINTTLTTRLAAEIANSLAEESIPMLGIPLYARIRMNKHAVMKPDLFK